MDYALSQAIAYLSGEMYLCLMYDIMCQFWVHLIARWTGNSHLSFQSVMEFIVGIGLFHVGGHQRSCYSRFASHFMQGVGKVDGEILETLWAILNLIASSCRTMTTSNRKETLNYHINDGNWSKMLRMRKRHLLRDRMPLNCIPQRKDSQKSMPKLV